MVYSRLCRCGGGAVSGCWGEESLSQLLCEDGQGQLLERGVGVTHVEDACGTVEWSTQVGRAWD